MNVGRLLKGACFSLIVVGFSSAANAELVNADWVEGDGKAAIDTNTNKGWLDFTETAGYSLSSIVQELDAGGKFEGWRLPTPDEVEALFISAMPGWNLIAGEEQRLRKNSSALRYQSGDVQALRQVLGYKYSYYTSASSNGLATRAWARNDAGDVVLTGAYRHHYWNGPYDEVYFNFTNNGAYTDTSSNGSTGVWLVVDNASVRLGGEKGLRDVDSEAPMIGMAAFVGVFMAVRRRQKRQAKM